MAWLTVLAMVMLASVNPSARTETDEDLERQCGFQANGSCQVFVRVFSESPFVMDVNENSTLAMLEAAILAKKNVPAVSGAGRHVYRLQRKRGSKHLPMEKPGAKLMGELEIDQDDEILVTGIGLGGVAYGVEVTKESGAGSLGHEYWDHIVKILNVGAAGRSLCTGTLLGHSVLTAAHCIGSLSPGYVAKMRVELPARGISLDASSVLVHPNFIPPEDHKGLSPRNLEFDLAIIRLNVDEVNLNLESPYSYICVSDELPPINQRVEIAGYGMTESGSSGALRTSQLSDSGSAVNKLPAGASSLVKTQGAEAAGSSAASSCAGDSGGPWFVERSHSDGTWGVVLLGVNAAGKGVCSSVTKMNLFVATASAKDWLHEHLPGTCHMNAFSDCNGQGGCSIGSRTGQ